MSQDYKKVPLKKIIQDCENCHEKVEVSEVAEIMQTGIAFLYEKGSILKRIEKTIGEDDFNCLMTSILSTFYSNLFINATCKSEEQAVECGQKINASGFVLMKKKEGFDA